MSSHPVVIVQVDEIMEHPNADRLELARVKGWQTVIGKGSFKAGDDAIYIPIDSVLDRTLENHLFPPEAKVKLSKSRVKSIRIRQAVSQGMLINPRDPELVKLFPKLAKMGRGKDVADIIGVTKYEPPLPRYQRFKKKGSWKNHPMFSKYTDIENFKYYPDLFADDENISVTEKIHGTSARYGVYPRNPNSRFGFLTRLWQKLRGQSKYEFVYGSRNVQLQSGGKVFYGEDVYAKVAKQLGLERLLQPGEALYGEIVGPGIQKGFDYGFTDDYGFFAYDVKVGISYLDPVEFRKWCNERHIPMVQVLYEGPRGEVDLDALRSGPSDFAPESQPIKEGVVIKAEHEQLCFMGRKVVKSINDEYLLKAQTDFH